MKHSFDLVVDYLYAEELVDCAFEAKEQKNIIVYTSSKGLGMHLQNWSNHGWSMMSQEIDLPDFPFDKDIFHQVSRLGSA